MKTTLHMLATLVIVGVFSGGALSLVNEATAPRIAELERQAKLRAVKEVFPADHASSEPLIAERADLIAQGDDPTSLPEAYKVFDKDGQFVGYAVLGTGLGFQDEIKLMLGLSPDLRQVRGLYVISDSETPGLGTNIRPGKGWSNQFFGQNGQYLQTEPTMTVVKGARTAPNQVEAITAATISSKAVTDIVNQSVGSLESYLKDHQDQGGER